MCTDRIIYYKCGHPHSTESPSQRCEPNLINLKHPPSSPLFAFYRDRYFLNTARCLSAHQVVELRFEYYVCDTCVLQKSVEEGMKYVRERGEWEEEFLGRVQAGEVGRGWEAWKSGREGEGEERGGGAAGESDGGRRGEDIVEVMMIEVKSIEEVKSQGKGIIRDKGVEDAEVAGEGEDGDEPREGL